MRMSKLALLNFRNSFRNYLSLILSLAFTVMIFLDFQNVLASDSYTVLGSMNAEYVDMLIRMVLFVLGCFTFFFVWYSTNVFLTRRKKEIGIYIFMGLTNQQIGCMYAVETSLIGVMALFLGSLFGELFSALFQMILGTLSGLEVEVSFRLSRRPLVVTALVYFAIYIFFVVKGYVNIIKSSVSSMLSAAKQNEYVHQNGLVLFLKAVLGVGLLGTGFYLALKEDINVLANSLVAVVLVTAGVYLLFGGLIPMVFQGFAGSKNFLYRKERVIWVNSMVFRIRKNYRTYAMVCVLSLCSVTALACGFGMKNRYDNMERFRHTYTFQLLTDQANLGEQATSLVTQYTRIAGMSRIPILQVSETVEGGAESGTAAVMEYGAVRQAAEQMGIPFTLPEPGEGELLEAHHAYLMSFAPDGYGRVVTLSDTAYRQIGDTDQPYAGYFQENGNLYIMNAQEYEQLSTHGSELYSFNYQIADLSSYARVKEALQSLTGDTQDYYAGLVSSDPNNMELAWIRIMYSLCIFLFLVFIVAGGCIMYMKQYNDAFEERARHLVLQRIGVEERTLRLAVIKELGSAYLLSFGVMAVSSCFSVYALSKAMRSNLMMVHLVSVVVILAIFLIFYVLSVTAYLKNVQAK